MNSMHQDEEQSLGALLDDWVAESAPEDFARSVARAVQAERSARSSRWAARGVVVPLFLAALLISLGAAAALNHRAKSKVGSVAQGSLVDLSRGERSKVEKAPRLSFYLSGETGRAEPEASSEVESPKPAAPKRPKTVLPPTQEEEVLALQPPPVVHFPSCECGTSGVVCTCSD